MLHVHNTAFFQSIKNVVQVYINLYVFYSHKTLYVLLFETFYYTQRSFEHYLDCRIAITIFKIFADQMKIIM